MKETCGVRGNWIEASDRERNPAHRFGWRLVASSKHGNILVASGYAYGYGARQLSFGAAWFYGPATASEPSRLTIAAKTVASISFAMSVTRPSPITAPTPPG